MRGRSRVSTNNGHFFKSVFFYRMEKISLRCNNKPGRSQPGFTCPTSSFNCLGERVADIKKLGISLGSLHFWDFHLFPKNVTDAKYEPRDGHRKSKYSLYEKVLGEKESLDIYICIYLSFFLGGGGSAMSNDTYILYLPIFLIHVVFYKCKT